MGKALAQKAGIAALETTLRAGMPELIRAVESLQSEVRQLRTTMDARFDKVDARFDKVDARFERLEERMAQVERSGDQIRLEFKEQFADFYERLLTAINEVSHRVTRADQKLEDYSEFTRLASARIHDFLERVVRLEAAYQSPPKKRRAG
jgi:chromosome segregation ATPase